MPDVAELAERLGIPLTDTALLHQALVHRSVYNERPSVGPGTNERLEFLGDSVLGFVIADELYRRLPNATEGELTNLRASLVRKESLAAAARRLELGRYLMLGRGEEASGGRERDQILAAAFEAIVGAIYLSAGLDEARAFVRHHLGRAIDQAVTAGPKKDHKSQLQELTQARWQLTPVYVLVEAVGPDHAKEFRVQARIGDRIAGEGIGRTKQAAEQMAASQAFAALTREMEAPSPKVVWPAGDEPADR